MEAYPPLKWELMHQRACTLIAPPPPPPLQPSEVREEYEVASTPLDHVMGAVERSLPEGLAPSDVPLPREGGDL